MSQSPVDDFSDQSVLRYRQGWQALNRLLHENRSFSGNEKHNAYLNSGSGKYADISAVSGLDFPEDGRGLGPVDWDLDGDMDLWITHRTAPRIRFLANQGKHSGAFLALSLEGTSSKTNRHAIGARVTVLTETPLIKSTYAGEGFLSQGSGWLHFGLGEQSAPVDVSVRWPGGTTERFLGLQPNQFFVLRQGTGRAQPWQKPQGLLDLREGSDALPFPDSEANTRTILTDGLSIPPLKDTNDQEIAVGQGKPMLLNLWASWCRPCLEELTAWTSEAAAFAEAGLQVIPLNVDEDDAGRKDAAAILSKIGCPFPARELTPESTRALDIIQRSVLDHWEPLPIPCSFLIDEQGFLIAIYKGPTTHSQILTDWRTLSGATPEKRRDHAIPFPGIWSHDPNLPDPSYAVTQFFDHDLIPQALSYLQHATERDQQLRPDKFSKTTFADRYYIVASILAEQNEPNEAVKAYVKARDLNPKDFRVRKDLGDLLRRHQQIPQAIGEWTAAYKINPQDFEVQQRLAMAHLQLDQAPEALPYFQRLCQMRPQDPRLHYYLGNALRQTGRTQEALAAYQRTLKIDSRLLNAANNIAWIQATHPDKSLRNGTEAVRLAEQVVQLNASKDPNFLSTLAAAYAEAGQFEKALAAIGRARPLLLAAEKSTESIDAQQAFYDRGQPYRDHSLKAN